MEHFCESTNIISFVWVIKNPGKDWVFHLVGMDEEDAIITALQFNVGKTSYDQFADWFNQEFFKQWSKYSASHPTATACAECRDEHYDAWADSFEELTYKSHLGMAPLGVDMIKFDDIPQDILNQFESSYQDAITTSDPHTLN